ncbi:hypothetical protein [Nostoc sp.]
MDNDQHLQGLFDLTPIRTGMYANCFVILTTSVLNFRDACGEGSYRI